MGRRRRRVVRIVKKKLPTVFVCPRCGEEAVRVTIAKDTGKATVMCALCQLKDEFQAHPAAQMIDVYSFLTPNPPDYVQAETPAPETLSEQSASSEQTASPEEKEEEEPFADILENKDKKRYSSSPIPEQKSEQTSQA